MLTAILKSVRPHQWVKNLFVAAPVVFARRAGDPQAILHAAAAFACFCLLSSAVYQLNDLVDIEKDRAHPLKRRRPIASGALPVPAARVLAGGLTLGALLIALPLGAAFVGIAFGYLGLNIAYSLWLKKVAFVDVGSICLGFVLRVLGGAFAVPVPPSRWLLVCTLVLSALLAFGKRAHELHRGGDSPHEHREVLGDYSPRVLSALLAVFGLATVVTYFFWARSRHASLLFGTERLVLTVPFVGLAVYRFVRIVGRHTDESPTDAMLHDIPFVANLGLYAAAVLGILYFAR
jgi:decaprenyl-phosphate phosphoribosyltransferase